MKKTYNITVEEVEEGRKPKESSNNKQADGAEVCFEVVKNEYDHVFDRGDKLDTKINIALTFCGVILLFLLDLFKSVIELEFPKQLNELMIVLIYLLGIIFVVVLYIYCLVSLISLIKPTQLKRVDGEHLILKNLHQDSKNTVYTYVCIKYNAAIKENNALLEIKFNKYKRIVVVMVVMVITAFIIYFLNMII